MARIRQRGYREYVSRKGANGQSAGAFLKAFHCALRLSSGKAGLMCYSRLVKR